MKVFPTFAFAVCLLYASGMSARASDPLPAAEAVNAFGLDLLAEGKPAGSNVLLSPYSIQSALAMAYAGAGGATKAQMAGVLHYPADESMVLDSFGALASALRDVEKPSRGGKGEPVTLTVANRLFGQSGSDFNKPFLSVLKETFQAPLEMVNFQAAPDQERRAINRWVEDQTKDRIKDLIPPQGISANTRLVLVNAVYLKAPWETAFPDAATRPEPFRVGGSTPADVPTMTRGGAMGYSHEAGVTTLAIPYRGRDLQFVLWLPDAVDGLPAFEAGLTPAMLSSASRLQNAEVILHLPKFKMEPPSLALAGVLQSLGMRSAFDIPPGSADFSRMSSGKPGLFLSAVFHKTFLSLDEKGTEAAAATAAVMALRALAPVEKKKPVEVRVDRPFLFAIQHRPTGTCLFLGRLTDPRE